MRECDDPMGLENNNMLHQQITASSYYDVNLNPNQGRLKSSSSWSALNSELNEYLEFYFKGERVISGISTQGRKDANQWVTSYAIEYRTKNTTWTALKNEQGSIQVFIGNSDSNTVVTNYFKDAITCSRLRILPKFWHTWVSMRVELHGCFEPYGMHCDEAMGMENGRLNNDQITASTYYNTESNPFNGRLRNPKSWLPFFNDNKQYIEIYFKGQRVISGISTQGQENTAKWVNSYLIAHRTNKNDWNTVKDINGKEQIFVGNHDSKTIITNYFDEYITCSRLRLIPKTWNGHIALRMEVIGCFLPYGTYCESPMGMENGKIKDNQITASTYWSYLVHPLFGRLQSTAGWKPEIHDDKQYLEIYFKGQRMISGMSTQGRNSVSQWVNSYSVACKTNNNNWNIVKDISGKNQTFNANYDSSTIITNYFDEFITCSRLRIIPKTWHSYISLRLEVLGCFFPYASPCEEAIGAGYKSTKVDITASSYYGPGHEPQISQLGSLGLWATKQVDTNQYLEMNFATPLHITAVSTQGRASSVFLQWVKSYKVSYINTNGSWTFVMNELNHPMIFPGNYDPNTTVTHFFDTPITTTKFRILPLTWYNHITMRAGLLGCRSFYKLQPQSPPPPLPQMAMGCSVNNNYSCHLQAVEPKDTIGIIQINYKNMTCSNAKPIDNFFECNGWCSSRYFANDDKHQSCKCAPSKATRRMVKVECKKGLSLPYMFLQPSECSCDSCPF